MSTPLKARHLWLWEDGDDGSACETFATKHEAWTRYMEYGGGWYGRCSVFRLPPRKVLIQLVTDTLCVSPCGRTDQAPPEFRAAKGIEAERVLVKLGLISARRSRANAS